MRWLCLETELNLIWIWWIWCDLQRVVSRVLTYAMATLLPSMMMCLSSWRPGSLGSSRVYGVFRDCWKRVNPVSGSCGGGSLAGGALAPNPWNPVWPMVWYAEAPGRLAGWADWKMTPSTQNINKIKSDDEIFILENRRALSSVKRSFSRPDFFSPGYF